MTRTIGKRYDGVLLKTTILIGALAGSLLTGNSRAATTLPETRSGISVLVDTNGDYEIRSRELAWTFGGTVGYPIQEIETMAGRDTIGVYREVTFRWAAQFSAGIRSYDDKPAVLFSVDLPAGAKAANVAFPSFTRFPAKLHGFSYGEENFAPPSFSLEENGTPWLLFDDAANTAVISPATNFLVARMFGDGKTQIASGLNLQVGTLDRPLTQRSLLVLGHGVGTTFQLWGKMLTDLYGKKRPTYDADPTLKYFGYWTDNGADYYYKYDKDLGYCGTLLKMVESYRHQGIGLGYFQLDSWWYQKSTTEPDGKPGKAKKVESLPAGRWNRYGGTMDYTADPDLFPNGLAAFQKQIGLPLVVHGRWVDRESPYQKQYRFSGVAPVDPRYWEDRMTYLATNGVVCYEQDWLDRIYNNSDLGRKAGLGDEFTDGMAEAAAKHGLVLQYCMALPRYFLQGAKYSNLTTIRTSGDRFEPGKWRHFLYTSQLASALGMWPWCDVFKSGEMGNMIVSVLSAGAVGTGDTLGKEVPENIHLAARADGVLVKPDRPMVPTDDSYLREAEGKRAPIVAWTSTDHGEHRTVYAFAFMPGKGKEMGGDFSWSITPAEFGMQTPVYVYDVGRKQGKVVAENATYKAEGTGYAFVIIAPIGPMEIAFLGDLDKIASMGKQRIAGIDVAMEGQFVKVLTGAGETAIALHGYAPTAPTCRMEDDGKSLPVQYDSSSKQFGVTIPTTATGGEHTVVFSRPQD